MSSSTKNHLDYSLWPGREKYTKHKETLFTLNVKFTALIFSFFCSVWIVTILLFPFSPPSDQPSDLFLEPRDRTPKTTPRTEPGSPAPPRKCEENFSVYVYDLPPEFNSGLLRDCRHLNVYTDMCPHVANRGLGRQLGGPWFATHQFIGEMIFHARVENHPCRTRDPSRATLFYVPFYGGLHASSMFREANHSKRDDLAVRLVEHVRIQQWWKRRSGADHFLALGRTAWDFMRREEGPDFGANSLLKLPHVKNMTVLTVERQPWKGSNQFGIPYPSYFHPHSSEEMIAWQEKVQREERTNLFSFVGGTRKGVEKAAVRDELVRQCNQSSRCELVKCGSGASRCHNPHAVLEVMRRSHFCLQAPGDSFTRRSTFDAMLAGCIPVFFSPHTAYTQYMWHLPSDAKSYSIAMNESAQVEAELSKIPSDEVARMRRTVVHLIPRLTYAHPNATWHGLRDAVDVALASLAQHVRSKLDTT